MTMEISSVLIEINSIKNDDGKFHRLFYAKAKNDHGNFQRHLLTKNYDRTKMTMEISNVVCLQVEPQNDHKNF